MEGRLLVAMKLSLANLGCDEFDLRTANVPATVVTLKNIRDGAGVLEFGENMTLIDNLAIRELLAAMEFPIAGGKLYTDVPATISHVTCQGRIRNGFSGQLRAAIIHSEAMCLELDKVNAKADLLAEELLIKIDGRGGRIEVGTLTLKDSQLTVGGLFVRLGALSVRGLKVAWDEGRPRVEALKAHARDLHIQLGGATIDIAAIDLPEGLRVHEDIDIAQILVGAIEIAVDDLVRKASAENAQEEEESDSEEAKISMPAIELDHNVFDTINGNLSVDATLSVTLPVIGKRVATHSFRIPVAGGIIDYRDFERGLSDLEDAFIDIRVRGNRLVLERDIPLIPGLHKPIVTWDLSSGELELAKQHLVRIGTLPKFKLASFSDNDEEESSKKSKVRLHRLDFDGISIHLSLDETAVLKSGEGGLRAHIDDLDLAGSLHFDPDPEDEVSMTALAAKAKGLGLVASKLRVGKNELSGALVIGSMERFQLGMDELRPTNLNIALKNIALSGLHFRLNR